MSVVKAVPSTTQFVEVPEFAQEGSRKVEERRSLRQRRHRARRIPQKAAKSATPGWTRF